MNKTCKIMALFLLLGVFSLFCLAALKQSLTLFISIRSEGGDISGITARLTGGETTLY